MDLVIALVIGGFVTLVVGAILGIAAHRRTRELAARLTQVEQALRTLRGSVDAPASGAVAATARRAAPEPTRPEPARDELPPRTPLRLEPPPATPPPPSDAPRADTAPATPVLPPVPAWVPPLPPSVLGTAAAPTEAAPPPPLPWPPAPPLHAGDAGAERDRTAAAADPSGERPPDAAAAAREARRPHAPNRGELAGVERTWGLRGLTWVGVGLLFLGVAFFLKYAYDRDWLGRFFGPRLRIATAAGVALALAAAGWRSLARGMPALGQGLLGGGQALLYLTVYAAFQSAAMVVDTPLLGATAAFVLMVAVTIAGLAVAVRLDAVAMAFLAVLGGFATPLLAGSGQDARDVLCGYLLLLDCGVLLVAYHRRWRALDLLAFAGTALLFGGWWAAWGHAHPQPDGTIAWLCAFHVVFVLLPFAHHWRHRTSITVERFALALANVAWTFAAATWLLAATAPVLLAGLHLAAAALHALLGVVTATRVPDDRRSRDGFLALAILLLTLALFHLLPADATTTAWLAEAAVLLWLGYRHEHALTRRAAMVVLAVAIGRTLVVHLPDVDRSAGLAWNPWFGTLAVASAGLAATAAVHARFATNARERLLARVLGIAAGLWALLAGALEIVRHAHGHPALWTALAPALAVAWLQLVGVAAFVLVARRIACRAAFLAAFVPLLAAAIAVGVAYDRYPATAWPALNATCATGLAVVGALVVLARAPQRFQAAPGSGAGLAGVAQLATTVLATVETVAWLQRGGAQPTAATTTQVLGQVWLALAVGGALAGAAWASRRVVALAALPLALAAGAAFVLYGSGPAPARLLANERFLFAALVAAVVAAQRPLLRRLAAGPGADHAAAAALALLLAYWTCEAVAWTNAGRGGGALGDLKWLLGAGAVAGAAGGAWRARATGNPSLHGVAHASLGVAATLSVLVYTSRFDVAWMFANARAALAAATVVTAARCARREGVPARARALRWLAFAVALLAVTLEPPAWFLANVADPAEARRLATFAVTVTWIVVAVGCLVVGFRRDVRAVRLVALALFALTAVKLLLFDMSGAQQLYRILAFVLVGLAFVGASWLYHRLERRLAARGATSAPLS
jgi:uncharacterized membrane protein